MLLRQHALRLHSHRAETRRLRSGMQSLGKSDFCVAIFSVRFLFVGLLVFPRMLRGICSPKEVKNPLPWGLRARPGHVSPLVLLP